MLELMCEIVLATEDPLERVLVRGSYCIFPKLHAGESQALDNCVALSCLFKHAVSDGILLGFIDTRTQSD